MSVTLVDNQCAAIMSLDDIKGDVAELSTVAQDQAVGALVQAVAAALFPGTTGLESWLWLGAVYMLPDKSQLYYESRRVTYCAIGARTSGTSLRVVVRNS